jgi:phosphoglycolate phosphatase
MPTHLLFDLDGTLTDPREGILACHRHALTALGLPIPSETELEQLIGPPLHSVYAGLLGPARASEVTRAVELYRERYASHGQYENTVFPDIPPGLAALASAGFTLLVCTSKAEVFAESIVEHFDLARYFRKVYGADLSGARAEKGELIAHLLKSEGLAPGDALMIGDRMHDVRGAHAHGVQCAGVLWGFGTREELAAAGADSIHASVAELLAFLGLSTQSGSASAM